MEFNGFYLHSYSFALLHTHGDTGEEDQSGMVNKQEGKKEEKKERLKS